MTPAHPPPALEGTATDHSRSMVPMTLSLDHLAIMIDTYTDPDGVRLDPALAMLALTAAELRALADLLLADADLLDAAD